MNADETHSNEYAKGNISTQTFNQRIEVGKRRQSVGSYRASKLGQSYVDPSMRQRSYKQPVRDSNNPGVAAPTRQKANSTSKSSIPPRQTFTEPQSRGYNPYA
jgi:hypothetical protein